MSDKEKEVPQEETFEDIFSNLREKYNLDPFSGDEKAQEKEEEKVFYNPTEDKEIDNFFKEREEGYAALYEEVDDKIAGVDDEVLRKEAEVFNLEFSEEQQISVEPEPVAEYEDIYSDSKEESEVVEEEKEEIAPPSPPAPVIMMEEFKEEPAPKKKGKSVGEIIRIIVLVISIIALIGSSAWLINDYLIQPYLISKQNEEISNKVFDGEVTPDEVVDKLNNLDEEEKVITFEELREVNPDFKAWIVVPGADISLPVVQGKDNDKYLKIGFKGKYLAGGTAFIDANNRAPFSDMNTTIYGHNMRDGSMFSGIKKYTNPDVFKKNPYIYIYTENQNYVYKIFSVFLSSAVESEDNGYLFRYNFRNLSTSENFASFMEEIKLRSYYNTGVDYGAGDKIITLSTCDKTVIKNGRLVLVGRLVRENEEVEIDTSVVSKNTKQKFPAAWYEKKKVKNPYENAIRWIPQ